jgi:hypothetical protein
MFSEMVNPPLHADSLATASTATSRLRRLQSSMQCCRQCKQSCLTGTERFQGTSAASTAEQHSLSWWATSLWLWRTFLHVTVPPAPLILWQTTYRWVV